MQAELGHPGEAARILSELRQLPPGLEDLRGRLFSSIEGARALVPTPGDLDGEDVRSTLQAAEAALLEWLRRVEGWRRVLHV
ncbi:MAG: hypothetical protein HY900_23495 [Deltaproteobacteria bacterium]|nr:hypothetical protein [Deltaproteobacteria bacterium]